MRKLFHRAFLGRKPFLSEFTQLFIKLTLSLGQLFRTIGFTLLQVSLSFGELVVQLIESFLGILDFLLKSRLHLFFLLGGFLAHEFRIVVMVMVTTLVTPPLLVWSL